MTRTQSVPDTKRQTRRLGPLLPPGLACTTRNFAFALLCATDFCVTSQHSDGFRVKWANDEDAAYAIVELSELRPVPAQYTELSHWSFSSVTNLTGTSRPCKTFQDSWPDLVGDRIYEPTASSGVIQLGTSENPGFLCITSITQSAEHLIFRAKVKNDEDRRMRIERYEPASCSTNFVVMTEELSDYAFAIAGATNITLRPNSLRALVQISDIRLVSDYHEPSTATNSIYSANAGLRTRWTFRGLSPGDYAWRIQTFFSDDTSDDTPSTYSPFFPISLSPLDPPLPRGTILSIQ